MRSRDSCWLSRNATADLLIADLDSRATRSHPGKAIYSCGLVIVNDPITPFFVSIASLTETIERNTRIEISHSAKISVKF